MTTGPGTPEVETPAWRGRWVLYALGALAVAYGMGGLLLDAAVGDRTRAAVWFVGGAVAHDALLAPAVLLVAALAVRYVPAPARAVVQGALFVSGVLVLVSVPLLTGRGGVPDNPTTNPLPYGRNIVLVLLFVWAVAGLLVARRVLAARRQPAVGRG